MAKILKSNPNHQREAFAKLLEKYPNHQSEAGRLGGKIGGYLGGNITGPKTIWKALEWKKEHPERAWKQFKICQEAGRKWRREHPIEVAGYLRKARKAAIESYASGRAKRNFAFRGKFLWHDEGLQRHFHRSLAEMIKCNELYESIGRLFLHPNLYFKGIELDWAVSKDLERFDKNDPLTWDQVIEYHPVIRTWKGETSRQDYENKRIEQIRSRGIRCDVHFV